MPIKTRPAQLTRNCAPKPSFCMLELFVVATRPFERATICLPLEVYKTVHAVAQSLQISVETFIARAIYFNIDRGGLNEEQFVTIAVVEKIARQIVEAGEVSNA